MKTQKIKEGKVEFYAPLGNKYETPVFYNPEGTLTRNISISSIQNFQKDFKKKITICDALAGTGIAGLRYAKELTGVKKVFLVDKNPLAVNLIKKNIKLNKLSKKCSVEKEDANIILRKRVFNVIDLDPFGSPNIFIDSTARSIYHKGFLAITATDQAPLCGTYPLKCLKKYGIKSIKTEFYNELGIRILISFIILSLSRYGRAFVPVLSLCSKHYYRIFGKIEHQGKISKLIKEFRYLNYCPKCGERTLGFIEKYHKFGNKKHKFENCGLIYLGKINDAKFCKKVLKDLKKRDFKTEEKLIEQIMQEANMPPFYYDIHRLAKRLKKKIPKTEVLMKKLKNRGFKASRTHFSPVSIKTDAKMRDLRVILR
jgi:tRNA (guanine26-N2/guanine27-N2)-dimethyltransferase